MQAQSATAQSFPRVEFILPIKSRLAPRLRTERLELILSIFESIKRRGVNFDDCYNLNQQRVTDLIKTRDIELAAQGFSWNMDFKFFFDLLKRTHPVPSVFLARYAYNIFHVLAQIHTTDPTMSVPKLNGDMNIDIIRANVEQELRGRLTPCEIEGFVRLAKKVFGVDQE